MKWIRSRRYRSMKVTNLLPICLRWHAPLCPAEINWIHENTIWRFHDFATPSLEPHRCDREEKQVKMIDEPRAALQRIRQADEALGMLSKAIEINSLFKASSSLRKKLNQKTHEMRKRFRLGKWLIKSDHETPSKQLNSSSCCYWWSSRDFEVLDKIRIKSSRVVDHLANNYSDDFKIQNMQIIGCFPRRGSTTRFETRREMKQRTIW